MALPLPSGPGADSAVTLARIEVKLDSALRGIDDHEGRIRALEARNWPRQGVNLWLSGLAVLAAGCTVLEGLFLR